MQKIVLLLHNNPSLPQGSCAILTFEPLFRLASYIVNLSFLMTVTYQPHVVRSFIPVALGFSSVPGTASDCFP